ncbi:hypothetical protein V8C37DRAFT_35561 [Trichoderma ceciliae]
MPVVWRRLPLRGLDSLFLFSYFTLSPSPLFFFFSSFISFSFPFPIPLLSFGGISRGLLYAAFTVVSSVSRFHARSGKEWVFCHWIDIPHLCRARQGDVMKTRLSWHCVGSACLSLVSFP